MTDFTVSTTSKIQDNAITATREEYNTNNPQNILADNASYVMWFVDSHFNTLVQSIKMTALKEATTALNNGDPAPMAALLSAI